MVQPAAILAVDATVVAGDRPVVELHGAAHVAADDHARRVQEQALRLPVRIHEEEPGIGVHAVARLGEVLVIPNTARGQGGPVRSRTSIRGGGGPDKGAPGGAEMRPAGATIGIWIKLQVGRSTRVMLCHAWSYLGISDADIGA